jgi:hypothetical protein
VRSGAGRAGAVDGRAAHLPGYDPAFKSEMGEYDPAARQAPCSTCTAACDRDGDGWREQPDGKPLVLEMATQPDQTAAGSSTS